MVLPQLASRPRRRLPFTVRFGFFIVSFATILVVLELYLTPDPHHKPTMPTMEKFIGGGVPPVFPKNDKHKPKGDDHEDNNNNNNNNNNNKKDQRDTESPTKSPTGSPTKAPTDSPTKAPTVKEIVTSDNWFDALKHNPLWNVTTNTNDHYPIIKVGLVTTVMRGPAKHIFLDGLQSSDAIDLVRICMLRLNCTLDTKLHPEISSIDVWVVDANGVKVNASPNDFVHQLLKVQNPTFRVLFVDYSDRFVPLSGFLQNHYPNLTQADFQQSHVRFALRGIVKRRNWYRERHYIYNGFLVDPEHDNDVLSTKGGPALHAPFCVRSDVVDALQYQVLPSMVATNDTQQLSSTFNPADLPRDTYDIVHLWEVPKVSSNNLLRNVVTTIVQSMRNRLHPIDIHRRIRVETSIQGERGRLGRDGLSLGYIETMLSSKIVVVTQRDQWEDHFRLFEALVCGAMVLMDEMLSLPHSLKDGESVVFFRSLEDLRVKATYYLAHPEERLRIARKGWEISMTEHRSWHRMEELLFGRALTKTRIEDSWFADTGDRSHGSLPVPATSVKNVSLVVADAAEGGSTVERKRAEDYPSVTVDDWWENLKHNPLLDVSAGDPIGSPIKVGLVTTSIKGPTKHILVNGLHLSEYVDLVKICMLGVNCTLEDDKDPINATIQVWIVDANSVKIASSPNDFVYQLFEAHHPTYRVLVIDYSDRLVLRPGFIKNHYPNLTESTLQQPHLRFALRGIVKYRHWRPKTETYLSTGLLVNPDYHHMLSTKGGPALHAPFCVRSDVVDALQYQVLPSMVATNDTQQLSSTFNPADLPRDTYDIVHLWEVPKVSSNNLLRNVVTTIVQSMRNRLHPIDIHRRIRVETSIQGERGRLGRDGLSLGYIETMLSSKIVVVTQRDQWEDHFRLFEALVCGAMVLMDEMLSLPHSLKDGESVVFFRSLEDLRVKATYYLAHPEERLRIARKGWEISMTEHRSWHRMEELLFGRALTKTRIEDSWFADTGERVIASSTSR